LVALVAGAVLGLVVAWLKWTPEYRQLGIGPLAYKLHWGAAELAFSLALAIAYSMLLRGQGESAGGRAVRGLLALANGTNLLYHFPSLFVVAGRLHETGHTGGHAIRGAEFRQLMAAGATPPLALHVVLASLALGGMMLLALALRWMRRDEPPADVAKVAAWGGGWALAASLAQIPVGLWTLVALPADVQSRLTGGHAAATLLFVAAMLAAVWLLRELAFIALGETTQPALARAMSAMLVVVALMTAMQQQSRSPQIPTQPTEAKDAGLEHGVPAYES
jgi:hypothetical protein